MTQTPSDPPRPAAPRGDGENPNVVTGNPAAQAGEPDVFSSVLATVRERPVTAIAAGVALFALSRTPVGRVVRPGVRLAMRTGVAASIASRAGAWLRRPRG